MSGKNILVERKDKIGFITLNRPEKSNTFNIPFAKELNGALWELEREDDIRVIVIKATGKHFSTGIALDEFKDKDASEYRKFIHLMDEHNHTIARMKKMVITSVKGYAIANGAGLAYASDFTIASEDAKFGTTAINLGLICLGPAVPLSRLVGRKKTLELILTGDIISAQEAEKLGLVNHVVPSEELEGKTMEWAEKFAQKSPLALQIGKRGIYQMQDLPYHQAIDYMGELFASLCLTEDAKEGVQAFLKKRKPLWKKH
ncbi:MAG: enoyl-CoA hydratase/isomerase family protein [Candidatus Atribacteria bacterium]|nr:enoyl-CoA hydratase/isomerase family protein [Candidatus Atribacteria bacterium]